MIQGSEEWLQARLGRVTASRVADVVAKTKTGYSASRANYMAQLIAERLTGVPQDRYTNGAMQWGTETEPEARAAYEFYQNVTVEEVGYIPHFGIDMAGCSPDGLIGDVGLVELKCPNTATHIETLLTKKIPDKYIVQMQWQMACTKRQWCDFGSYDPRMPEEMQLFVKRVPRDGERILELETEVTKFLCELGEKIQRLRGVSGLADTQETPAEKAYAAG